MQQRSISAKARTAGGLNGANDDLLRIVFSGVDRRDLHVHIIDAHVAGRPRGAASMKALEHDGRRRQQFGGPAVRRGIAAARQWPA